MVTQEGSSAILKALLSNYLSVPMQSYDQTYGGDPAGGLSMNAHYDAKYRGFGLGIPDTYGPSLGGLMPQDSPYSQDASDGMEPPYPMDALQILLPLIVSLLHIPNGY